MLPVGVKQYVVYNHIVGNLIVLSRRLIANKEEANVECLFGKHVSASVLQMGNEVRIDGRAKQVQLSEYV